MIFMGQNLVIHVLKDHTVISKARLVAQIVLNTQRQFLKALIVLSVVYVRRISTVQEAQIVPLALKAWNARRIVLGRLLFLVFTSTVIVGNHIAAFHILLVLVLKNQDVLLKCLSINAKKATVVKDVVCVQKDFIDWIISK